MRDERGRGCGCAGCMMGDIYRYMFVFQLEALKKYANKGVRFFFGGRVREVKQFTK